MTANTSIKALLANVGRVILGKPEAIELAVLTLICRGHLLIEDVPGLGKTMLARSLARSLQMDTRRLQCTPDLLPSDITGVPVYNQKSGEFAFRPGPVFTHILLADELNRATPRAQSALLECMEEHQVSVDGVSHALPPVFMVIATQNPIEIAGTYLLPEAQLDRFFIRMQIGYPGEAEEVRMLDAQAQHHPIEDLAPVADVAEVLALREAVKAVHIGEAVRTYLTRIVAATRSHADLRLGASPRGSLALSRASQGHALMRGAAFVTPDMVKRMAPHVLAHRLILKPQAQARGQTAQAVLTQILAEIEPPV